ncbi:MAG: flagellar basal-body rod protein FlgB [Bdellovibrionales bacterium RBG_16_40_8]|nr:MAG: flagellar basal-body rod protein FlgB [Bdellovibrionales bacterium RBG_16_40_8]
MSGLFDKTTDALGSSINFRLLKQNVASSNIANAETPGYKAKKVDFEQALSRALDINGLGQMSTDHPDHFYANGNSMMNVGADVYENPDITVTNDGNTVDLEREMAELSENTILYRATLQLINKKLAGLAYAATEGSGAR